MKRLDIKVCCVGMILLSLLGGCGRERDKNEEKVSIEVQIPEEVKNSDGDSPLIVTPLIEEEEPDEKDEREFGID